MYICFNVTQDQKRGYKPGRGATPCGAAQGLGKGLLKISREPFPRRLFSACADHLRGIRRIARNNSIKRAQTLYRLKVLRVDENQAALVS